MTRKLYNKLVEKYNTGAHCIDTGMHDWYCIDGLTGARWMVDKPADIDAVRRQIEEQVGCKVTVTHVQYDVTYKLEEA